jgi:hypothetical protein
MNPSGIGGFRRRGPHAARADVGDTGRQPHDAGPQCALHERRPGVGVAVHGHLDSLARGEAEPLGVGVSDLDPAPALELELRRVVRRGA